MNLKFDMFQVEKGEKNWCSEQLAAMYKQQNITTGFGEGQKSRIVEGLEQ